MVTLYGIPNCDTVKKARAWLVSKGVEHHFHDFKKSGVPNDLDQWVASVGWEKLLNRKGNTWRKISPEQQAGAVDAASAIALMRAYPSAIKRPVMDWGESARPRHTAGFDAQQWEILCSRRNTGR